MKETFYAAALLVAVGGAALVYSESETPEATKGDAFAWSGAAIGRPIIPQHHARNRPGYGPLYEPVFPVLNSQNEVVAWELHRNGRADSGPIKLAYGDPGHFQTFTPDWSRRQWATNYGMTVDYSVPPWAQIP